MLMVALKVNKRYKECPMDLQEQVRRRKGNLMWERFQAEGNTKS